MSKGLCRRDLSTGALNMRNGWGSGLVRFGSSVRPKTAEKRLPANGETDEEGCLSVSAKYDPCVCRMGLSRNQCAGLLVYLVTRKGPFSGIWVSRNQGGGSVVDFVAGWGHLLIGRPLFLRGTIFHSATTLPLIPGLTRNLLASLSPSCHCLDDFSIKIRREAVFSSNLTTFPTKSVSWPTLLPRPWLTIQTVDPQLR